MELRIEINSKVIEWLASMGYPVAGMPVQMLRGMLLREARQWQMSPERLETMILESTRMPSAERIMPAIRDNQAAVGRHQAMASVPH